MTEVLLRGGDTAGTIVHEKKLHPLDGAGPDRFLALVIAVGCATSARALIGGVAPAGSAPAAVTFAAVLAAAVVFAGGRIAPLSWRGVAIGVAGGAALVALSLIGVTAVFGARAPGPTLAWWVPLVTLVAAVEELVFRGVLFDAVRARSSDIVAIAVTAALFAAIHLPLYGAAAFPLDLCVGLFLGCLRVGSDGVAAPLIAHVLADVATGWVG